MKKAARTVRPKKGPLPELDFLTVEEQYEVLSHRRELERQAREKWKGVAFGERFPSLEEIHAMFNLTEEEAEEYHRIIEELDKMP